MVIVACHLEIHCKGPTILTFVVPWCFCRLPISYRTMFPLPRFPTRTIFVGPLTCRPRPEFGEIEPWFYNGSSYDGVVRSLSMCHISDDFWAWSCDRTSKARTSDVLYDILAPASAHNDTQFISERCVCFRRFRHTTGSRLHDTFQFLNLFN